ncbi:MAG: cytochrome family, partial [Mycobacterium sp.]|nr:cytochrome family [Mycobacterium sp.]
MNSPVPEDIRLPPTPRWPQFAQNIAYLTAGRWFLTRMTKRYGTAFTMRIPVFGPTVTVTDPVLAKALFQQPGDAVKGVDANLGLVLGAGSTFGLQGEKQHAHRKLILPQFHGNRMRAHDELIEQEVLREVSSWPEGREFPVLPSTLRITLHSILRTVFGAEGPELRALLSLMPRLVSAGERFAILPWLRRDWGKWSPWGRVVLMRKQFDQIVGSLIDSALADPNLDQRVDVLSLLLQARYDDGTPMSRSDVCDELLTLVVAGHETTANELAWAFERLRRHPDVLRRLTAEVDEGGSSLLRATVQEVLRTRPVIDGSARKVVAPSIALGPWRIPRGYNVAVSISLMHFNELVYEDARAFKPDRFVGK